jgi:glycolate oxidase iron-sulfur subunit
MREVQWHGAPPDADFVGFMDACVQCRGCEAACPSGVPFGHRMVTTREALAELRPGYVGRSKRLQLRLLAHHRTLLVLSRVGAVAQRLRLVPRSVAGRLGLPQALPLRQSRLRASGDGTGPDDVWLLTGCVMDAWQRRLHRAVQAVVEAAGGRVALAGSGASCCGALYEHAGLGGDARHLAVRTIAGFPGSAPVLVDSAGCGAAMKAYGALLGTTEAEAFSARVLDVHEWLAARIDRLPAPVPGRARRGGGAGSEPVAVQDPCHLRHVQRAHDAVPTVLARYVEVVELDDDGLCCGAGGAYATEQPELAGAIRQRKVAAIERTGAGVVASANPGCLLHLQRAGLDVRHPCELVADAAGLV